MTYDAVVVGVGGMGGAAAYHLARRGARVLALERFAIPHDRGSSHGETRIIRLAYAEHPVYVPLARRAFDLWRRLEETCGERLLVVTGGIDAGAADGATVQGALRSCAIHGLAHEVLDAPELHHRFPGYRLTPEMVGVHQPDAGYLLVERCVVAHAAAAREAGAEIHDGEPVVAWRAERGRVMLTTPRSEYRTRRVAFTAGPWTGALLPALARAAVPERQVVIWTRPRRPERFRPDCFPVFNLEAPEGRFYGCPIHVVPGVKFGRYHHLAQQVADPDDTDRTVHPADEAAVREGIGRYFPDADGPMVQASTCLFTNSPDEHFVIDRLPELPHVVVAAGFSGHGFKFASAIGETIAEIALEGGSGLEIGMFGLSRPALAAVTRAAGEAPARSPVRPF